MFETEHIKERMILVGVDTGSPLTNLRISRRRRGHRPLDGSSRRARAFILQPISARESWKN